MQEANSQASLEVYGPFLPGGDVDEDDAAWFRELAEEAEQEGLEMLARWSHQDLGKDQDTLDEEEDERIADLHKRASDESRVGDPPQQAAIAPSATTPLTMEQANKLSPNRDAGTLLQRGGWESDDRQRLHLLALALWGLEQGIAPSGSGRAFDQDALVGTVANLSRRPVAEQLDVLGWPDDLPDLLPEGSAENGAQEVIDRLWAEMSPTSPDC